MKKPIKWGSKRTCKLTQEQADMIFKHPMTCGACGRRHVEDGEFYMLGEFLQPLSDSTCSDALSHTGTGIPVCKDCGDKARAALQRIRRQGIERRKP